MHEFRSPYLLNLGLILELISPAVLGAVLGCRGHIRRRFRGHGHGLQCLSGCCGFNLLGVVGVTVIVVALLLSLCSLFFLCCCHWLRFLLPPFANFLKADSGLSGECNGVLHVARGRQGRKLHKESTFIPASLLESEILGVFFFSFLHF